MNELIENEDTSSTDINLRSLEILIKEEQRRLEEDKLKYQRNFEDIKKRRSDGNLNQPLHNDALLYDNPNNGLPNNLDVIGQIIDKYIPSDKTKTFMIKNSREEEINKLIDKISKPKEQPSFKNRELRRSYPLTRCNFTHTTSPIDIREKEKDQLSEKLASSESPLTKPSSRQIAKNLYSSITFSDCKQNNVTDNYKVNQVCFSENDKNPNADISEEYLRTKYNHPRIVISHHKENNPDVEDSKDSKMVRIGEFSPLNPNLPGGATVLGLGDWEDRRQYLLEKYKQVSRSPSPSPCERDHNHNRRSVATQTELSDNWSSNVTSERSPQHASTYVEKSSNTWTRHGHDEDDQCCSSPQFRLSPIPKCFENMSEKEVKEFIYRQELEKQIEEKNRLKEEMKKKEAEEEAKIEAKIQRDLEKMKRQYEEERLQRLELAIRMKEKEEHFSQKLAIEQSKVNQEGKTFKKRSLKNSDLQDYVYKQYEKSTQSDLERPLKAKVTRVPYSRSLPDTASVLSTVHKELQQPLLPSTHKLLPEGFLSDDKSVKNTSLHDHKAKQLSTPSISEDKSKEVDILAQQAVFVTNTKSPPRMNNAAHYPFDTVKDKLKEVDKILKQPLLPESQRVLPPVSQPLIHATVPPLSTSLLQTPRGSSVSTSTKTNAGILEDKWKVPYVEQNTVSGPTTKHNPRILTQLGTFRRQLQEESLRMRQRVREESP